MITMADGPVANIPAEFNAPGFAVAGYVNKSGIGVTYPQVVTTFPKALHLSITTNGSAAQVADVEKGAMTSWAGYDYGYCSVSNVNTLIARFGRPKKLWTAHQDPKFGAHICSPKCWPGLVTTADGTQWIDHGGKWDESLLSADFFDLAPQPTKETQSMDIYSITNGTGYVVASDLTSKRGIPDAADGAALSQSGNYLLRNLTEQLVAQIPDAPNA